MNDIIEYYELDPAAAVMAAPKNFTKEIYKFYCTNNQRKRAGLPLHRKKTKGKRYLTRCEASETIEAFLDMVHEQ